MIALLNALDAGLFQKKHWFRNLFSGSLVGIIALPLAMAFAIASGLKPEQGIYTAIIASFVVSLFGGSPLQIAGPTGAFVFIISGIILKHGLIGLGICTLMAGLILIAFGVFRLGGVIRFIPSPVILGFSSGIGALLFFGQWEAFLGLPKASGQHFHQKLWDTLQHLPHLDDTTTILAVISLALLILIPKTPYLKKAPAPVVVLVLASLAQYLFQFEGIATIGSHFGGIPTGLPTFQTLPFGFSHVVELIAPAFTMAILISIESLLTLVVSEGLTGKRYDANQELIGEGIANCIVPFFGGFPLTATIARTSANIRYGGNSPLAGITHATVLLLFLILLAPLAQFIPLYVLASILLVVAYNMLELRHFFHVVTHAPKADISILIVTFFLTLFMDLVVAVNIGMILTMLTFLGKMSTTAEIRRINSEALLNKIHQNEHINELPSEFVIYTIEGPFFFGVVENFRNALKSSNTMPKVLLIRLNHVPFIDLTGLETFTEALQELKTNHVTILLSEANKRVYQALEKNEIFDLIGEEHYFKDFSSALIYTNHLIPPKRK